jgi:hypothetical protein
MISETVANERTHKIIRDKYFEQRASTILPPLFKMKTSNPELAPFKETKQSARSYGRHKAKQLEDDSRINTINHSKVKRHFRPKAFSIAPDTTKPSTFSN